MRPEIPTTVDVGWTLEMWRRMKPMTIELFQTYWSKIELEVPLMDYSKAIYKEWRGHNDWRYSGMCIRTTGKKHGIVRMVAPNGDICEGSFKNEKRHGLCRKIE